MANEIYYSGLGDLRLAAILQQELVMKLADRASLRGHQSVIYLGNITGEGSTAAKVGIVGLDGFDVMSSVAENATTSNTALTDAAATITVARYAKQYQMSDMARFTDSLGELSIPVLVQDAVMSADMTFQTALADVTDGFANNVGTTTVDLSLDNFYDAVYQLESQSVPGPYLCMLHPVQYADFQNSLRAEAGAIQFMPATAEALSIRGPGFKGSFAGCEIFVSSKVPTANGGADRAGAMWGRGAVGYKDATPLAAQGAGLSVSAGPVMIEFERDAGYALTKVVSNYYFGVGIIEDLRGVSIITDA